MVEKGSFNIPGKAHVPNRYFIILSVTQGRLGEVGIYIIVRQGSAVLNRILCQVIKSSCGLLWTKV